MALSKRITSVDVAKHAGVSQSTVSMILNNKQDASFSPETRERVLQSAKELGYQLKKKSSLPSDAIFSKTIIVMCPSLSNQYYTMLIQSVTQFAQKSGYNVFVGFTLRDSNMEKHFIQMFDSTQLAGIIYLYQSTWPNEINKLVKHLPVVFIGDKSEKLDVDIVELNSKKTGWLAGDHLLSLGHQTIAYITTELVPEELARNHRLKGLRKRFDDDGLPKENIIVKSYSVKQPPSFPIERYEFLTGYHLTKELLTKGTKATALVGSNDMVALGIMDAVIELKYKIPQDFSICGCDNIPLSATNAISMTTVDHAIEKKGEEAVKIILQKINSPVNNRRITTRLEYEPVLIPRSSTGVRKSKS